MIKNLWQIYSLDVSAPVNPGHFCANRPRVIVSSVHDDGIRFTADTVMGLSAPAGVKFQMLNGLAVCGTIAVCAADLPVNNSTLLAHRALVSSISM